MPILASKGSATVQESRTLIDSLARFKRSVSKEDSSPIVQFLAKNPGSTYTESLWLGVGLYRLRTGYFERADYCLNKAWDQLRHYSSGNGKVLGDRALGELLVLEAHSGKMNRVCEILDQIKGRPIFGSATQRVAFARSMMSGPSPKGPLSACATTSLSVIAALKGRHLKDGPAKLLGMTQTSLAEFSKISRKEGIRLTPVRRGKDAQLIVPSVAHFKTDHYAVVTKVKDGFVTLQDMSFPGPVAISMRAFEEDSSGFFLIPSKQVPRGWGIVSPSVAGEVVGASCAVYGHDPGQTGDGAVQTSPSCGASGMTTYNMQAMQCGITMEDTPVGYKPAIGPPVECRVSYAQKEYNDLPENSANFGPKWKFQFASYVQDQPSNSSAIPILAMPGGGFEQNSPGIRDPYDGGLLTQTSSNPVVYTRSMPDGSQYTYAQSDGGTTVRNIFLTKVADPQGNFLTLSYTTTSGIRLDKIRDQFGRSTSFNYGFAPDPFKITKITDPFGRSATFTYESSAPYHLSSITDTLGITSSYQYLSGTDFVQSLTTPYGTSTFATSDPSNNPQDYSEWVEATDALGRTERAEFEGVDTKGLPVSEVYVPKVPGVSFLNSELSYRQSLYWNKLQFAASGGDANLDYTKARQYNWLYNLTTNYAAGLPSSIKEPLEYRKWFNFSVGYGFSSYYLNPNATFVGWHSNVARALDNGQTWFVQSTVNPLGFSNVESDAVGRIRLNSYAPNGQDLLTSKIQGPNGSSSTVFKALAYYKHRPTIIIDSNGGKYGFTYNQFGQPTSVTNPLGQTSAFVYDGRARLVQVIGPNSKTLEVFSYDSLDRVAKVTDSLGQSVAFTYDAADRVLSKIYQDGTSEKFTYTLLDLASRTDRQHRTTYYTYNSLRQPLAVLDPNGGVTHLSWCLCGHLGSVTDSCGRTTTLDHDIEGRVTRRTLPDGSSQSITYAEDSGWPQSITDGAGQTRNLAYNPDGSLQGITYANTTVPTPPVSYEYDPFIMRVTRIADGTGVQSLSYARYGSPGGGLLSTVTEAGSDTINLTYDALGRLSGRSVGSQAEVYAYDALGRVSSQTNPLGAFNYEYLGSSHLPTSVAGGAVTSALTYDPLPAPTRLSTITNSTAGSTLDSFGYSYNPVGTIASWSGEYSLGRAQGTSQAGYDKLDRLTSWVVGSPGSGPTYSETFKYDPAGNRLAASIGGVASQYSVNSGSQYVSQIMPQTQAQYAYAYDGNGSLCSIRLSNPVGGSSANMVYDGENRLSIYRSGNKTSKFYYNSQDRLSKVEEYQSGSLTSVTRYLWMGLELLEARSMSGIKHFYAQGVLETNGAKYYYSRDHLGSIRNVVDSNGVIQASYQYDPFGVCLQTSGAYVSDLGFQGFLRHPGSGLLFSPTRAYSPQLGRWLSRDPIQERGGLNLYAFVNQNPLSAVDITGLVGTKAVTGAIGFVTSFGGLVVLGLTAEVTVPVAIIGLVAFELGVASGVVDMYKGFAQNEDASWRDWTAAGLGAFLMSPKLADGIFGVEDALKGSTWWGALIQASAPVAVSPPDFSLKGEACQSGKTGIPQIDNNASSSSTSASGDLGSGDFTGAVIP